MRSLLSLLVVLSASLRAEAPLPAYDVVVYGGTSAAIIAAVQARKMGKTVVVVSPDRHLGGLSSGGLGWTDSGEDRKSTRLNSSHEWISRMPSSA